MAYASGWENVQYQATGATTATGELNDMLKEFYTPQIQLQFDTASPWIERLKKVTTTQLVGGKYVVVPLELGPDPGGGSHREGQALAHPGEVQVDTTNVYLKRLSHSIAMTFQAMKVARGGETAFIKSISKKVRGVAKAWKRMLDRQSWGDGTGILIKSARVSACSHAGTANTQNATWTVAASSDLRHMFEGQLVDVIDDGTNTTINNGTSYHAKVTTLNRSAKTFVLDIEGGTWAGTCATSATFDQVLTQGPLEYRKYDGTGVADTFYEIMGLAGIVSTGNPTSGNLQGLAVATYPWWKAQASTASSNRTITEKLMLDACNLSFDEEGMPSIMLMNRQTYAAMANNLVGDKRHIGTTKLKSGMEVPTFDAAGTIIPILAMRQCEPNMMYIIDESTLFFIQAGPVDWVPGTMNSVFHWSEGNARVSGAMFWLGNLALKRRNTNVRLANLTVT